MAKIWCWGIALAALGSAGQPRMEVLRTLRGNGNVQASAVTVDRSGNIYVTGSTTAPDLATSGAFQTRPGSSNLYRYDGALAGVPPHYARSRMDPNRAKFQPIYPPTTAEILHLEADPGRPGTVYAGTLRGLLRTVDNGATWLVVAGGLPPDQPVGAVATARSEPGTVYAMVHRDELYKSTDAAATWQLVGRIPLSPCPQCVFPAGRLAVDPTNPSRLLAFESWRSTDGGRSWQKLPLDIGGFAFDTRRPGVVYGFANSSQIDSHVVRSTDGGETWVNVYGEPWVPCDLMFADPVRPGTVYSNGWHQLLKSTDQGASWQVAVPDFHPYQIVAVPGTDTLYALGFGRSGYAVIRSDDGFGTYSRVGPAWPSIGISSGPLTMGIAGSDTLLVGTSWRTDLFVTKLNPAGDVLFTTYVGGPQVEEATAIAVDPAGDIYVAGWTVSSGFPFTAALASGSIHQYATFLVKLSGDGRRLLFATLLSPERATIRSVALDRAGNIYLAGDAWEQLPTTQGVVQPQFSDGRLFSSNIRFKGFAAKLAPDGKTPLYLTHLGDFGEIAWAVAVDAEGNATVAGTRLWRLNPTATQLIWDRGPRASYRAAVLDEAGSLYLSGAAAPGFPTTPQAFQSVPPPYSGPNLGAFGPGLSLGADAFVAKLNRQGETVFSTLLGGESAEGVNTMAVDSDGNVAVAGITLSGSFPTRAPLQGPLQAWAGFLAKLTRDGSDLVYSTYLGQRGPVTATALALDAAGRVVIAISEAGEVVIAGIMEVAGPA